MSSTDIDAELKLAHRRLHDLERAAAAGVHRPELVVQAKLAAGVLARRIGEAAPAEAERLRLMIGEYEDFIARMLP